MNKAISIHRSVHSHLMGLQEVHGALAKAATAWRERRDGRWLAPALDGLLGAIEDIELECQSLTCPRHRFVLMVLRDEAQAMIGPVASRLAEDAASLAYEVGRLQEQLAPFLVSWGARCACNARLATA